MELTTESPLWVGAWWVGFLGTGAAAFLTAIPILGYPRQLPGGCVSPSLGLLGTPGQSGAFTSWAGPAGPVLPTPGTLRPCGTSPYGLRAGPMAA